MTLLIILIFIVITLSVWNLRTLYELKKFNKSKQEIKDDKYYELKYKLEFVTTIAIVVIGVGGFFGNKVSDEINLKADKLKSRLDSLDNLIVAKKDTLYTYDEKTKNIYKNLTDISSKIAVISNKNIVKQDFFISDNLKFAVPKDSLTRVVFYFKNLKTLTGDPFPSFDKVPFLVVVPENSAVLTLSRLTKDYFEIYCDQYSAPLDSGMFGIMVSRK